MLMGRKTTWTLISNAFVQIYVQPQPRLLLFQAKTKPSAEMYCTYAFVFFHNKTVFDCLQNWIRSFLIGLEKDRSMAINYEPFGPCQTLWDRAPLNLAITMGLCDCLNVLFSKWCGSLRVDNAFTLHHVTRPLLFAAFCTNRTAFTHLQHFGSFVSVVVLFSATLKWIKRKLVIWQLIVVSLHTYHWVRYNPVSGCILKLSFISAQRRLCVL